MSDNYPMLFDFKDKSVVVTGGAGLLGSEIVKCFCAFRAHTILADVDKNKGEALVQRLRTEGSKADFYFLDLSSVSEIPSQVEAVDEAFGPVNVWVNCAYPRTGDWMAKVEEVTVESWQQNVDMHLNGYCISSNEIAKRMAKRGGGSIVNIGSIHCHVAPDFNIYEGTDMTSPAAYTAIKGGISMYSKYLASYFGKDNVRVNVVSPGGISNNQPEEFLQRYTEKTCLGRMAEASEIAPAVVFIASDAASYITGTTLVVDGGLTAI
jgi:NAD(P)-dependent dehydrogenase (short-subunit alcohol dehydrogenase family)